MNFVRNNRMGRFIVGWHDIENEPNVIQALMAEGVIVVDTRAHVIPVPTIEYKAYGHMFDPVPKGQEIPLYDVLIGEAMSDRGKFAGYQFQFRRKGYCDTFSTPSRSTVDTERLRPDFFVMS